MEHDRLTRTLKMNRKPFRRRTGVYPETFAEMEAVMTAREARKKNSGRPAALSVAEQLLMTLEFWREYRTFAPLGEDFLGRTAPRRCRSPGAAPPLTRFIIPSLHQRVTTLARWGVHEATVHRTVERVEAALIERAQFQMLKKRVFQEAHTVYSIVAVDASEVPCERPKKAGRPHTGAVLPKTAAPLVQRQEKAAYPEVSSADVHGHAAYPGYRDQCGCRARPEALSCLWNAVSHDTALIGDAGYQGLWRSHPHAITPHKATRASPLSTEQRQENRELAYTRQGIEHVIRRMKIFRVLGGVYRHRRRRFALRVQRIAARCNLTRACPSSLSQDL